MLQILKVILMSCCPLARDVEGICVSLNGRPFISPVGLGRTHINTTFIAYCV